MDLARQLQPSPVSMGYYPVRCISGHEKQNSLFNNRPDGFRKRVLNNSSLLVLTANGDHSDHGSWMFVLAGNVRGWQPIHACLDLAAGAAEGSAP